MSAVALLGWVGAFLLLLAYFLLIHKNLTSRSRMYQWMNIIGSLLLAVETFRVRAYPSFITNTVWFLVALYGIFHAVRHHNSIKKSKR